MHEYFRLKTVLLPVLERVGFRESNELLQPDVFGSAWSEFALGTRLFRLVWDGKDGFGFLQIRKGDVWDDIPVYVPEGTEEEFILRTAELVRYHRTVIG